MVYNVAIAARTSSWVGQEKSQPEASIARAAYQYLYLRYAEARDSFRHDALNNARPPVSPALRCLALLTVLFFGVYLLMVCVRICRMHSQPCRRHLHSLEAWLRGATEALALVPMLCILMISARVRAMQLGCMHGGDPPFWAQVCMYMSTISFVLYLGLHALFPLIGEMGAFARNCWRALRCLVSAVKYGGCAAIFCSVLVMSCEPPRATPPHTPMMACVTALTIFYFTQYLSCEVIAAVRELFRSSDAQSARSEAGSGSSHRSVLRDFIADVRVMRVLDISHEQMQTPRGGEPSKPLGLQFTPMLCVLLVSIALRQMQLSVEPQAWACAAMFLTTAAIIVQAVIAVAVQYLVFGDLCELAPADEAAGKGGQQNRGTPTVDNAFAFECCKRNSSTTARPIEVILMNTWWVVVISFHIGVCAILVSVFNMEEDPLHAVLPEADDLAASTQELLTRPGEMVPVSTPMRCVMMLSILYFGIFFWLMILRAASGCVGQWVAAVMDGIQRSLAFAPMLCVMMIGVRLRAMQLRTEPQPWAGLSMYLATFAVMGQVFTAMFFVTHRDSPRQPQLVFPGVKISEEEMDAGSVAVCWKMVAILLIISHYLARFCLYAALAVLITALFIMEPSGEVHSQ
mmetsp:Transcript_19936/g.46384  ORF Transcript_19936/g.46384 Transcript_19936/m.46384 type:complete len:630 (+) Transcript_19936:66-1955(+)